MPAEAASATSEILLLAEEAEDIAVIKEAAEDNRLNVVAECPDILSYLRQEGPHQRALRPDMILLDMDLSRTKDCEVLEEIKRDPRFKRIPVVVLASSDRYEDIVQAYDLHANAYLVKPSDRKELALLVRSTLRFWLELVRLPKY